MDYAALSPHVGSWAVRDSNFGDSSMRGGAINWGNIGSRLSSALSSTGRWLYNAGNKFVHSNTFNQIKQGIKDSGVIQNAANLAGETINALTDIGRLKVQQDIERLRRKALGEEGPVTQAELAALLSALQNQVASTPQVLPSKETHAGPVVTPTPPPANTISPPPPPTHMVPTTRPIPEMVTEVRPPITSSAPAIPVDPPIASTLDLPPFPPREKRRRKRPSNAPWRSRLNSMTGSGVRCASKRMCY